MTESREMSDGEHFLLPPCTGEVSIETGSNIAVLRFQTLAGQTLSVPMPIDGLALLARAIVEAVEAETSTPPLSFGAPLSPVQVGR